MKNQIIDILMIIYLILQLQLITMKKNSQKKQERVIHKGMYIANQRRKGPGGRIKCQQFTNKIQVTFANAALHESEVEWVQIRRYKKGDKRPKRNNKSRIPKYEKLENKQTKPSDKTKKFVEKNKLQSQKKNQSEKQKQKNNQGHKDKADSLQKQQQIISVEDRKQVTQIVSRIQNIQVNQEVKNQTLKEDINKQKVQETKEQNAETQSQRSQESSDDEEDETNKEKKTQGEQSETIKVQRQKKKPDEQIIVAKIIKQTKIVYKEKRFVGIMTCEKKNKKGGNSFMQKDIGAVDQILKDYFLDVTPIHLRLPKMQLDTLVKENISVLTHYIQKIFPQKGKQLSKKKLNQILDEIQSIYVVGTFNEWGRDQAYVNIHQIIGKTMTIQGECNCFLYEHQLNDFTYESEDVPSVNKQPLESIKPKEHHKKLDRLVFTIDPSTSIDLDDALSIEQLQGGIFQIGIHIADVSEYLDYIKREQLLKRTTSVYLPHKVYHMLTQDIMKVSSLNQGVERLAFSIYVKMNEKGQMINEQSRLEKNIVTSKYKLSYETVQDILTAKTSYSQFTQKYSNTDQKQFDELVIRLQNLAKVALAHRQKRIKFEVFENKQVHFELDQNRWPVDISVQTRFASKKIVQQFMIIGNIQAAKHLINNFKDNSLVIYHPKPSDLAVKNFNDTFKDYLQEDFVFQDIQKVQLKFLQIQNDKNIPQEVKQYMYFKGRRVQQAAGYKLHHQSIEDIKKNSDSENQKLAHVHFALGQDFYTHFTSPMRRMADILVHQTLNSLIYHKETPIIKQEQIQKINNGRRHTKRLKRDLNQMYICLMIHKTGNLIKQEGIVVSFGLKSLSVYIPYFDMTKQIMWKDQLDVHKVSKNRQDQEMLDVCIYFDRRSPSKDIIWKMKKFDKVNLTIDCTRRPPLRLSISMEVDCKNGKEKIYAINPDI